MNDKSGTQRHRDSLGHCGGGFLVPGQHGPPLCGPVWQSSAGSSIQDSCDASLSDQYESLISRQTTVGVDRQLARGAFPKALRLPCTVSRSLCALGRLAPAGAALCPRMVRLWVACISHVGQPGAGKAQDLENSEAWLEPQNRTTERSHIYEVAFLKSALCSLQICSDGAADLMLMSLHPHLLAACCALITKRGHSYHTFEWISDGIQLQDVQVLSGIIGRV